MPRRQRCLFHVEQSSGRVTPSKACAGIRPSGWSRSLPAPVVPVRGPNPLDRRLFFMEGARGMGGRNLLMRFGTHYEYPCPWLTVALASPAISRSTRWRPGRKREGVCIRSRHIGDLGRDESIRCCSRSQMFPDDGAKLVFHVKQGRQRPEHLHRSVFVE